MQQRANLTDRAKRYRAQNNVTGPRRCVLCGSRSDIQVMHLSGNEDDGERANLAHGCRSCNGKLSAAFKSIGAGRRTKQYNPASGIPTFEQYAWAVSQQQHSGEHGPAGAVIHATPKHKRIEYARRIVSKAQATKRERFEDRWNPAAVDYSVWNLRTERPLRLGGKTRFFIGSRDGLNHAIKEAEREAKRTGDAHLVAGSDGAHYFRTNAGRAVANPWPFSSRKAPVAAHGGIAYHMGKSKKAAPAAGKRKGSAARVPDDKTIQEGFKRGLSLSEILAQNPAMKKRRAANPSKFDRCVKDVKAKGGAANAYAVCTAAGTRNPSAAYEAAYQQSAQAIRDFKEVQAAYRSRQIGDAEFLAGRRAYDAAMKKYDAAYSAEQRKGTRKKNPAAGSAKVFEEFHGFQPSEVIRVTKKVHYHEHLAAAGKLTQLDVWGIDDTGHKITGFKGAMLAFNEEKNQLFIEGGDQAVNLKDYGITSPHEMETLGEVTDIGYHTRKEHLGDEGGEAIYVHKFRSTNKDGRHVVVIIARYPDLIYRYRDEALFFSGGSYEILAEGINK